MRAARRRQVRFGYVEESEDATSARRAGGKPGSASGGQQPDFKISKVGAARRRQLRFGFWQENEDAH